MYVTSLNALPHRDHDERTCIVVVNVNDNSVGLVVDKVSEVITIPANEIEPPPGTNRANGKHIAGMGRSASRSNSAWTSKPCSKDEELEEVEAV